MNENGNGDAESDDEEVPTNPSPVQAVEEPTRDSQQSIQILDLPTNNPVVSYGGQIYLCSWGATLGTDVLLQVPSSEPTPEPDYLDPALAASSPTTPYSPLLTTTRIKLVGRPVDLKPRKNSDEAERKANDEAEATQPSVSTASTSAPQPAPALRIPIGPTPSRARQQQAAFLEKIMAIKERKGEMDKVTVHVTNPQTASKGKKGKTARTANSRRVEFDISDSDGDATPAPTQMGTGKSRGRGRGGKPRGRRPGRRLPYSGLLRDQVASHDGNVQTPARWNDLEGGDEVVGGTGGGREQTGDSWGTWRQRLLQHLDQGETTVVDDGDVVNGNGEGQEGENIADGEVDVEMVNAP